MKREIKFRAWVECENKMVYPSGLDFTTYKEVTIYVRRSGPHGYLNTYAYDEIIIMQSTGLKDKNGKDIFDSDRVKRRVHLIKGKDYMDYNCEVRWIGWSYALYIADKHCWPLDSITAREVEVIGNIYEL